MMFGFIHRFLERRSIAIAEQNALEKRNYRALRNGMMQHPEKYIWQPKYQQNCSCGYNSDDDDDPDADIFGGYIF